MPHGQQTTLYPMVQFKPNTWEIDEFDCASMFLLIGDNRAMLIDAGMGIGDLHAAVRLITDKPIVVVITHGHVDHIQHAYRFGHAYLNERDWNRFQDDVDRRRYDAGLIAARQKGIYPYDIERDITPWTSEPELLPLEDGQMFDLGGDRKVVAYACPGHSPGQMMLLDRQSRSLFVGDALNNNLGVARSLDPSMDSYVGLKAMLSGLRKMEALMEVCDGIYNGHHDYRALGAPLARDVLPNTIELVEGMVRGEYELHTQPNRLFPDRTDTVVRKENTWIAIDPRFLPPKRT